MGRVCKRDKLGEMINFEGLVNIFSLFKTFLQKGDFDNVFLFKKNFRKVFFHEDIVDFFLIFPNFTFSYFSC